MESKVHEDHFCALYQFNLDFGRVYGFDNLKHIISIVVLGVSYPVVTEPFTVVLSYQVKLRGMKKFSRKLHLFRLSVFE